MDCPKCGFEMTTPTSSGFTRCRMCGYATWCGPSENKEPDKKEEAKRDDKCPNCGHDIISSSLNGKNCVCLRCGWKWGWDNPAKNSQPNPYTDFAKEMSLLREAMRDQDFKGDMLIDILVGMSPVVWAKVYGPTFEEAVEKEVGRIRMKERIEQDLLLREMRKKNKRRYSNLIGAGSCTEGDAMTNENSCR